MSVPYFHFKRKLTQTETYTEWSDNRFLVAGVRSIVRGDNEEWKRVKDYFQLNRVADLGEPGEGRLGYIRELINKMDANKEILKGNKSLKSFFEFFTSTAGEDLLDGSMTNADGGKQNRICIEQYINDYVNRAIAGDKNDYFTRSKEHLAWKSFGRKYTDFRELYGKFYDIVKVTSNGQLRDYCVFARFTYNKQTGKMSRHVDAPEKDL